MKHTAARHGSGRWRRPMPRLFALLAGPMFAAGALVLFSTPGKGQVRTMPDPGVPVVSAPVRSGDSLGMRVYNQTCAYCHDHGVGPVIRQRGLDPAAVRLMVRHGWLAMPAFRSTEISDAELDAVAVMLRDGK